MVVYSRVLYCWELVPDEFCVVRCGVHAAWRWSGCESKHAWNGYLHQRVIHRYWHVPWLSDHNSRYVHSFMLIYAVYRVSVRCDCVLSVVCPDRHAARSSVCARQSTSFLLCCAVGDLYCWGRNSAGQVCVLACKRPCSTVSPASTPAWRTMSSASLCALAALSTTHLQRLHDWID